MINPKIFKAYDIRGIYPDEINEEAAYGVGRALVKFLNAQKIVVGRDSRGSSPALIEKVIGGIIDQGADVYDLGLASTPFIYYASGKLDVDGAVSLTASHNPAQYNGIKLCRDKAVPIGEASGLLDIKNLAISGEFEQAAKRGSVFAKEDIKDEYFDYIASFADFRGRTFKVVADVANAMGIFELEILKRFAAKIKLEVLFGEYDSKFPNHEANPLKSETLDLLRERVVGEGADLGIAYDGDADRIGFVTEKGEIAPMDFITAVLAKIILKSHPGGKILYDLRSSRAVREIIEEKGGVALECPVGHTKIKRLMREEQAVFAGELSGHYYFLENFMAESSTLAAIFILNTMADLGEPLSELLAEARRYFHSGEINSDVTDKEKVFQIIKEKYADGKLSELDGIKIEYPNWWFSVRASNTEPVVRLNLEAKTQKLMEEKREELINLIAFN